jgi:hypothetical protein
MEEKKNSTAGAFAFSFGMLLIYTAIVFLVLLIFFRI